MMDPKVSTASQPANPGKITCSACGGTLHSWDLFCPQCGPPEPPPEEVPEALSRGQTTVRILGIIGVFIALALFKMQPDLGGEVQKLITGIKTEFKITRPEDRPQDTDFQLIHTINVPFANMRAKATTQSRVITVLERGQKVSVLFKGDHWTQIEVNGTTGWVATQLLDSKIE